jgi:hypothetical protein
MIETMSREDFARAGVTLWAIWCARRKIIYDDEYTRASLNPLVYRKLSNSGYGLLGDC